METDNIVEKVLDALKASNGYPDYAKELVEIGIESYTVDVSSEITLYRFVNEGQAIKFSDSLPCTVALSFNKEKTSIQLRDIQQGKTDYTTFLNEIAKSGVRFYEAALVANLERLTYICSNSSYEEEIRV
jgi:uncharacterized protein YbcV (DUF1398 family)